MKKALILLSILLLLLGTVAYQHNRLKKFRAENGMLNSNIGTLTEGITRYKTQDSLHAATVGILELKTSEYRKLREEDARLIEELKIRLKRVENVSRHATKTTFQLTAPIRDTVFVFENRPDTARHFSYRSPYVELEGILHPDSIEIGFVSYDTLLQVVHRIPKRFLFFRYGTKSIRQEIVSKNPHTQIHYTEYIQLKK